jgi:hypothetical protein
MLLADSHSQRRPVGSRTRVPADVNEPVFSPWRIFEMISMRLLRRVGVSAAFALGAVAATSFTPREALAGWTCRYIDGPNAPSYTGRTASIIFALGQSVSYDGRVWPFYSYGSSGYNKYGVSDFFGAAWTFAALDGPSVGSPGATEFNGSVWAAYIGVNSQLKVAHGTYTAFVHNDPNVVAAGLVSLAGLGTKLYAAYGLGIWSGGVPHQVVRAVVFDSSTSSWGSVQNVDGDVGTPDSGENEEFGTAIAFNGAVRVYFWDGELKERTTTNGTTWSSVHVIDGSGTGGQTSHDVGRFAKAMIDASGILRVFYWDYTASQIRVASTADGSTWSYGVAATNAIASSWVPIAHTPPQVYYFDTSGALRGASLIGSTWSNGIVDGPGSTSTTCSGHITTALQTTRGIMGVEQNGGPHIFYVDSASSSLREAYYTP